MWRIHTTERHLATKGNEVPVHDTTQANLETWCSVREASRGGPPIGSLHLYGVSRAADRQIPKADWWFARGLGEGGMGVTGAEDEDSLGHDGNVLRLDRSGSCTPLRKPAAARLHTSSR